MAPAATQGRRPTPSNMSLDIFDPLRQDGDPGPDRAAGRDERGKFGL